MLPRADMAILLMLARRRPAPSDQKVPEKNHPIRGIGYPEGAGDLRGKDLKRDPFLLPDREMANWANK